MNHELILYQLTELHNYARTTADISSQEFFFACTVNAAVAAFLVGRDRTATAQVLPWTLIAADVALFFTYLYLACCHYPSMNSTIDDLHSTLVIMNGNEPIVTPFPQGEWSFVAGAFALVCFIMAAIWFYFFVARKGRELLRT